MKRAHRIPSSPLRKAVPRKRCSLAEMLLQIPEGDPIDAERDAMLSVVRELEPAPVILRSIRAMR